jgi:DNA-binding IclR family transcriptional regulator
MPEVMDAVAACEEPDAAGRTRRPALAAQRAVQIINLLAANPGRSFTLSEIMRATRLNVSSCHSLLRTLTGSGYLTRESSTKSFTLGPVLVAAGQAAWEAQPLARRAKQAAEDLTGQIRLPVVVTAACDDEFVAIFATEDPRGAIAGLRPGARSPMAAPLGGVFVAWAGEDAIKAWLTRRAAFDPTGLAAWQRALAVIRQRGFQVTLRPARGRPDTVMRDIAAGIVPLTVKEEWDRYFSTSDPLLSQLETIDDGALYDVMTINVPIFNAARQVVFSLGVSGFRERVSGERIASLSDELLRASLWIMSE